MTGQPWATRKLWLKLLVGVITGNGLKQARLGVTMASIPGLSEEFLEAFEGMDVSAFVRVEEDGTLFARPTTRNTGVWQGAVESQGGILDAWYEPENPQAMADACDIAATIIRDAIAEE